MPQLTSRELESWLPDLGDDWSRAELARRWERHRPPTPWLVAGVVTIGLAAWAAYHFGPDLVRYIKIERM